MEEDDNSYDSIEEDDDSDSSVDLVSILKVKTPEQPQPVDKTWSALLVGSGVLLAVVAVGTLFFLTAMGFKSSSSHGVKSGALRSGGGGGNRARHSATTSEHSVSATQSTTRVRHVSVVHVTRHTGAGQLGNDSTYIASNASDSSTDSTDKTKAWSKETSSASSSRSGRITTSSTGGVRRHGNVTTTKRPSSMPTASTRKPITKTPLVCVFGNRIDWKMHFPDDGLCDFVFYDSLYGHPDNRFQADVYNFTADLRRWLAAAATYNVTEGGLAVTSTSVDQARRDVSSAKGKATVNKLRASGAHHYGVLDFVATNKTKDRDVKALFDLLKELKKLLTSYLSKNESFDHHLAVGITYFKNVNQEIYRSIEKAISEEAIPLLILRTHLGSRDDVGSKHCRITGSTVWGKPDAEQQPSMESALGYVLQRGSSLRESTRVLLSMSLAGRWYASLAGGKNKSAYAVGAKCKPFEFASGVNELDSRVTACTEQHYVGHVTRDEQREVMSTYDENTGLAFVFDSEHTLYAKVCKARNVLKNLRPLGVAVFDAEFDDWSNTCTSWNKFGSYTLMRAARKAVNAAVVRNTTRTLECAKLPA